MESNVCIYMDYENLISHEGLSGIDSLKKGDRLIIFYSQKASSVKIHHIPALMKTKASLEFVEVDTGTQNALDFQLIARLFYNIKNKGHYVIISYDKGYDAAIKMGHRMGINNISRYVNIMALNDARKNGTIRSSAVALPLQDIPLSLLDETFDFPNAYMGETPFFNDSMMAPKAARKEVPVPVSGGIVPRSKIASLPLSDEENGLSFTHSELLF